MKNSVEEICEFIRKFNLSPEMLILDYNENNTRARVMFNDSNIKAANFMTIEHAKNFIAEVKKKYYEKSETSIKRIK